MDVAGTTVGPYRVGRLLGQGGMGAVHEAVDGRSGARVAFKILLRPDASSHDASLAARRLFDEATAASALAHPFLVPLLDAGQDPALGPWLVYPFLPGGSLRDRLARGPLTPPQVRDDLAAPLLGALEALHGRGTIHRDVKPENLLSDAEGRFHLADLGLAWFEGRQARTATGVIVATPAYCAPERILRPGDPPGPACDVWAAAATLAEALTGRPLMDPGGAATNLQTVLARGYPASELRSRGVAPALAEALAPALTREPGSRPSAADLLKAFTAALDRPAPDAAPAPTRTIVQRARPAGVVRAAPPTRRRFVLATLALCLLTLGLIRLRPAPGPLRPGPTLPSSVAPLLEAVHDAAAALGPASLPDPLLTDRLLGTADLLFEAAAAQRLPWHLVADATRQAMDDSPPDGILSNLVTAAALQAQGNGAQAARRLAAEGDRVADLLEAPGPPPPDDRLLLLAVVAGRRLHGGLREMAGTEAFLDHLTSRIRRLPPSLRCGEGARAARLALTALRERCPCPDTGVAASRREAAALVLAFGPPALRALAAGWGRGPGASGEPPPADPDAACRIAAEAYEAAVKADDALRSVVDDNYDGAISAALKGLDPASMAAAAAKLSSAARRLETLAWLLPERPAVRLAAIQAMTRIGRGLRRTLFYQNFYKPGYFAPDDDEAILLDRLLDLLALGLADPRPAEPETGALHDARRLMDNWLPLDLMLRNWPEALPAWDERVGNHLDGSEPVGRLLEAYRALASSPRPDVLERETVEALRGLPLASPPTPGTLLRRAHAVLLQGRILRVAEAFVTARDLARAEQTAAEALHPSPLTADEPLFELWSMAVLCRVTAALNLGDPTGDGQLRILEGLARHAPTILDGPKYAADIVAGRPLILGRP